MTRKKPRIGLLANYIEGNGSAVFQHIGAAGQDWMVLACDYVRAIERAGGIPVILPLLETPDDLMEHLALLEGVVLTGGSDIDPYYYGELPHAKLSVVCPPRDTFEQRFVKKLLNDTNMPVLGICRGLQITNVVFGGTLFQDIPSQTETSIRHGASNYPTYHPSHTVAIDRDSIFYEIWGKEEIRVNSYHHQGICRLADGLKAGVTAPDGMIEGVEMPKRGNFYAVQWHPEMMAENNEDAKRLFSHFVAMAQQYREKKRGENH